MIGQSNLIKYFKTITAAGKLPRFILLIGASGSGRSLMAAKIAGDFIKCPLAVVEMSVEGVRTMINDSYKVEAPICYFLRNADDLSSAAKNALLKVTEEPPNNAYFIMSLQNKENTLQTILSRAAAYTMEPYTKEQIGEYFNQYCNLKDLDPEVPVQQVTEICETPGEIESFLDNDAKALIEFTELVVNNVAKVSGANALKMASRFALKEDKGFDLKLFWRLFIQKCFALGGTQYFEAIKMTSGYLQNLRLKGINKAMLFDTWVFDIRSILR